MYPLIMLYFNFNYKITFKDINYKYLNIVHNLRRIVQGSYIQI